MADNLTVGSPGAGTTAPAEGSKEKRVDDGRAELDRLRQIAKDRGGANLDDRTLLAIAERRKAKITQETQNKETRQAFETGRGKETVTSKATEAETLAARTTGTEEKRTADGLSERDRTAVRSDPKAGPRLPPSDAKPATPDQAKALVGKLLESFLQPDGKPLDVSAYAQTLTSRSPTQMKADTRPPSTPLAKESSGLSTPGQTSTSASSTSASAQAPGTRAPVRPQSGASTLSSSPRTPTRQPTGTSGQLPSAATSARAGLGMPTGTTSLSFRPGAGLGLSTGTGVSADGLLNAGGGIDTHSRFDGMHFNWDGFFANFLIRSQKDMQEWRKMMKELREAEGRAALAAHDAQIALLQMRQRFAREAAGKEFFESLSAIPKAMKQDEVTAAISGREPKRAQEMRKKLTDVVAHQRGRKGAAADSPLENESFNKGTVEGQVYLSEEQIKLLSDGSPGKGQLSPQQQYREALKEYKRTAGGLAYAAMVADAAADAAGAKPPPAGTAGLQKDAVAAREAFGKEIAWLMADPRQAALVNAERGRLRKAESQQREKVRTAAPADLARAQSDEASLLRQIVTLDQAMASSEPRNAERATRYAKVRDAAEAKRKEDAAPNQDATQALTRKNKNDSVAAYVQSLVGGEPPAPADGREPAKMHETFANVTGMQKPDNSAETIYQLQLAVDAADEISTERGSLYHNLKAERAIEAGGQAFRSLGADPGMAKAVDNAVQGAIGVAKKNRGETDALMRQTVARSQGMINQLIQLLGMSRSH